MAILAGGVMYPVFLRLFIWLFSHCVSRGTELHYSLIFLLHHPRRCYLLLFPSTSTWFLFAAQVTLNLTAWIFWILLSIRHPPIGSDAPDGQGVMDGLFQAHALRSAGFNITDISAISPALQFFYMAITYVSAFPVIMSLRQSNVYEERSLGQSDSSKFYGAEESGKSAQISQVGVCLSHSFRLLNLPV
jgi:Trk-type K+ transport system membrane component